ncbi:hypothetical protein EGW08_003648, partial [Elysia chlorotica]
QEDLADVLAGHITVVQKLKSLRPNTETQSHLLKTYIKVCCSPLDIIVLSYQNFPVPYSMCVFFQAKCEFYLEHMSEFRAVKHKLSESVPAESLDFIQRVMDKN